MNLIETGIPDLSVLEPKVFKDSRGYFLESFNSNIHKDLGLDYNFVQDNESRSVYGVIRGLHYQMNPMAQAKLVRVTEGSVLDVVVDIRKGSPTFGNKFGIILSAENKKQMIIPRGFAHGFVVLSKTATFNYKCDNFYSKEDEGGMNPLDSVLDIDWIVPKEMLILSDKDRSAPDMADAPNNFEYTTK